MTHSEKRIPLYIQLRSFVLEQIRQGVWNKNDQLPTEHELAAKFNVSRITVKNALQQLVKEGLIYRIQGKGTFLSAPGVGEKTIYTEETSEDSTGGAKKTIAFLMPRLQNAFTAHILGGIEEVLVQAGYNLLFFKTNDSQEQERERVRQALRLGVKGLIVFPVDGEHYNEELVQLTLSRFPLVLIDRDMPGIAANCVYSDHSGGAYEATRHLLGMGHRHIAYIASGKSGTTSVEERLSGFEKALAEAGITSAPGYRVTDASPSVIEAFLEERQLPTAIFAENSGTGYEIMKTAAMLGIKVPEQLSVVFFDDVEYGAMWAVPPTVVIQQDQLIGQEAARLLLSVIANPMQERRKIVLPTKLLVRESTRFLIDQGP
ncbi:GntR family transcriptional regulator [Paenibacillus nasutitermitis]|uniref:GntR family transcriptional regulator n=1 Tax=Paenibacillus nasutitermitis TaxID=1652958 RepID=A0A917DMF6_9BACL|nr:GntR family transcriptional regulator [Paenibacillus nasutitermitis]GGD49454.1 GntR family transcriptional regulator [Paenibacillus nasutitermitis]